ncbi:hypothetical protein A3A74_07865 [Candidatus Roizmanbacteria bacterium RIFCSPLOWO2_01_FULL_35_13]|uniref:FtsK gamma domain-containing protein n=1 Tax=Candidatus Roizmanbacteria bacterium RIFCSPLOWO2_01_FULL_35_13 TaxID=1802055 RepID=A0A1F7I997_9BACT|nr:MAG: hypothetical protein A3A74_07865 [Candidatus Roizmanbacteria bacterium RIFCSPLOWO2_01_FULL_35_13]
MFPCGRDHRELQVENDPLVQEVYEYLTKFDFPLAALLQRKFKIGFSRAERILKQLEAKKISGK